MDIIKFPVELFKLKAEEFLLMIYLINNKDYSQYAITQKTGFGMRKTPRLLKSLVASGMIEFKLGNTKSVKLLLSSVEWTGKLLRSHLESRHVAKKPYRMMTLAYLTTFMDNDLTVIKKRREIQGIVKTSKPTINLTLHDLSECGLLVKRSIDKSNASYRLLNSRGAFLLF